MRNYVELPGGSRIDWEDSAEMAADPQDRKVIRLLGQAAVAAQKECERLAGVARALTAKRDRLSEEMELLADHDVAVELARSRGIEADERTVALGEAEAQRDAAREQVAGLREALEWLRANGAHVVENRAQGYPDGTYWLTVTPRTNEQKPDAYAKALSAATGVPLEDLVGTPVETGVSGACGRDALRADGGTEDGVAGPAPRSQATWRTARAPATDDTEDGGAEDGGDGDGR
jgi:hypothetical protein